MGTKPEDLVRGARIGWPEVGDRWARLQAHLAMHQPCGCVTEQDGPGRRLLGEPGGALRRVPHGGVGQAPIVAKTAEEHPPRMQPLADDTRLVQGPCRVHAHPP